MSETLSPPYRLSVVIRCAGESSVFRCIASIDRPVDLVVTLPSDTSIRPELERLGARVVEVPRMQQGLATNTGVAAAVGDSVMIMDSDCWFEPGALAEVERALDAVPVVRTRVVYEASSRIVWSHTIAKARDFDNQGDQRYWFPGLALRVSTISALGGELCHPDLWWVEDADVHDRLEACGLTEQFHQAGVIRHAPITLQREIGSQVKYGRGGATRAWLRADAPRYFGRHPSLLRRFESIRRAKGLNVAILKGGANLLRTAAMYAEYRRLSRSATAVSQSPPTRQREG